MICNALNHHGPGLRPRSFYVIMNGVHEGLKQTVNGDNMAAKKKFYAVRNGKVNGIFSTWDECKASVDAYSGAVYKGFATLEEAREYLGDQDAEVQGEVSCAETLIPETSRKDMADREIENQEIPKYGELLAYVDGSYEDSVKRYAFGCVFLLNDGRIYTECGSGDNPQSLQHRNVTGEMLGAMYAVRVAMLNGFRAVELRYDYQGIEKWVTGEWRSKTELTQKYAASMREWSKSIQITFTKVTAHANVRYNELADQMAKRGLTEADGVPRVKKLEEMSLYAEND